MEEKEQLDNIIKILKDGKVILYPTDTVWGIGCDVFDEAAVEKIYHIKKRDRSKPLIILVSSIEMLKRYVPHIHPRIETLLFYHMKPLTIIYDNPINLPDWVIPTDNTIAIRLVKNSYIKRLLTIYDNPIISTSANIQGTTTPEDYDSITDDIIQLMDYVIPKEKASSVSKSPSVIIKYSKKGQIVLVR